MENLMTYTASALGYENEKPPRSPSRSSCDSFPEEAIEAFSKPTMPSSPTSTMDIQVITCVSYHARKTENNNVEQADVEHFAFKPIWPTTPTLDDDTTSPLSCDSDDFDIDCLSECSEELFGLQYLELDEDDVLESDKANTTDREECRTLDVAKDHTGKQDNDIIATIFEASVQTLDQLNPVSLAESLFPRTS